MSSKRGGQVDGATRSLVEEVESTVIDVLAGMPPHSRDRVVWQAIQQFGLGRDRARNRPVPVPLGRHDEPMPSSEPPEPVSPTKNVDVEGLEEFFQDAPTRTGNR